MEEGGVGGSREVGERGRRRKGGARGGGGRKVTCEAKGEGRRGSGGGGTPIPAVGVAKEVRIVADMSERSELISEI